MSSFRNAAPLSQECERPRTSWRALLTPELIPSLAVLLGGVLLHSMNVLLVATVLPSIVNEVGGAALMSWPTTAFLASSIVAATCTGLLTAVIGPGRAFAAGALIFCAGSLLCAFAPAMRHVILGRVVQGFGGGLLSAVAYILVRGTFPESLWPRVFALLASVWSISVLVGPLLGGVFATYGSWRGAFFAVAGLAGLLGLVGLRALPTPGISGARPRVPGGRVALIGLAIVAMSLAAIAEVPVAKAGLIAASVAALAVALRLDRAAAAPRLAGRCLFVALRDGCRPVDCGAPVDRLRSTADLRAGVPATSARSLSARGGLHGRGRFDGMDRCGCRRRRAVASLVGADCHRRSADDGERGCWHRHRDAGGLDAVHPGVDPPGGRGHWRLLGLHRPGHHERGQARRRGHRRVVGGNRAADRLRARGRRRCVLVANATGFSIVGDTIGIVRAAFWVPATFIVAAALAGVMGVRLGFLAMRARSAAAE